MRKLLQGVGDRLQAFVDQRDDVALILTSPATDALPILTLFEGLESSSTSNQFWMFTDPFTDPETYAAAVLSAFSSKHEAMRLVMGKAGLTPWPPIPERILAPGLTPAVRLRGLAAFSRELLPVPNGGTVVWIFYPLDVADPSGFAGVMRQMLQHRFPNPWCHHLRFIIRDEPTDRAVTTAMSGAPRIRFYQPDLSAEAIQKSMEEAVEDDTLRLEERVTNLMVLAGTDFAQHRYPEALEKYALLLQYHAPMGNHGMAALALNGMGESYEKLGDLERAEQSYQAALIPASHGEHPPIAVLVNVVLNLAHLRYGQARWAEAEGYYDLAQQLATVARDAPLKVRALEFRGICQREQQKLADAEQSWYTGSVIAAAIEDVDLSRNLVARLHQHYVDVGDSEKEREWRVHREALGEPRNA
jgi:tetratricopeptide (TPR) repeat protein